MRRTGKRNVIFCFAVLFLGAAFTGCAKEETPSAVPQLRVGVLLYKQDDTFITSIYNNFEKLAKQKEQDKQVKITVNVTDGKGNQSVQNDEIDKFIEQGYDVLCINLVDRTAASTVIDKAKNADIPIIFFNREPVNEDLERWDKVYYVGAVASESGIMQGQIIVEEYNRDPLRVDKNGDGKIQYVMLEGEQGHQDALIRTEFSIKSITASGIKVEKLANDTANWQRAQGSTKMAQWIDTYKDSIELVMCNNDDMALGAIDAYLARETQDMPVIVGVDCTQPALESIKEGYLFGTVLSDAYGQAKAMVDLAYSLSVGENPEDSVNLINGKYVRLPYSIVTKENADSIRITD